MLLSYLREFKQYSYLITRKDGCLETKARGCCLFQEKVINYCNICVYAFVLPFIKYCTFEIFHCAILHVNLTVFIALRGVCWCNASVVYLYLEFLYLKLFDTYLWCFLSSFEMPNFDSSLSNKMSWSTVSKAADMSRRTMKTALLLSREQRISFLTLTGGNWQKWKRVFLTCPCHEIYRDEAVGLKSCKNTWKITIFVKMWNLGQYRENLIFCQ